LENLVNNLAGGTLVEVHNMALAGSNTATGQALLEYELLPDKARDPDILINAYSTNDMHILTIQEAANENVTLRDKVFGITQNFVRSVMDESCNPPLLLYLDDYLGNEQREILATTELSQAVGVLADYYGFGFLSYASTVRDWVYGDTREALFSPPGWYDGKRKKMRREIHPLQGMHMVTSWIVAYQLLHLATTFCSFESWDVQDYERTMQYNEMNVPGLPDLIGNDSWKTKPRPKPTGVPPPLTAELKLDDVTDRWRDESAKKPQRDCHATTTRTTTDKRCPFSYVSGIMDHDDSRKTVESIQKYFSTVLVTNEWKLLDDTGRGSKYGWFPPNHTNTADVPPMIMDFNFPHHSEPIRTVTFFILKSYGYKWKDSTVQVDVQARERDPWQKVVTNFTMTGFHDKKTSEMYTEKVELPTPIPVNNGMSMRATIRLTRGSTFKLMGIAVCS
jgi:hypothetical protein